LPAIAAQFAAAESGLNIADIGGGFDLLYSGIVHKHFRHATLWTTSLGRGAAGAS
jgi:hypothetical protein